MFLGIDVGTSGVKSVLIDEPSAGQPSIVASASSALEVSRPHPGWSEQNPAHWLSATASTLDALKQSHPQALAAVRGIGLSGQMHGATLLDQADQVLRPCMLWNDTRSHEQAAALDANPLFRAQSGNIVFPGFTAPKLLWVREYEPQLFERVAKVLLPKDYVRLWLSGDSVSDLSDASGTAWLDVGQRAWSEDLLAASAMRREQMPDLVEGSAVSGQLRAELQQRWGITQPVLIAGGGGDNAASACGMGTIQAGQAFVSLGTSGVLFAANAAYQPNPDSAVHTFCHALPATWHQMGVILAATDALNWYARLCDRPAAELTAALGDGLRAPSGVSFLPYLAGERTPHNNAEIRAAFVGLSHQSDQQVLTQAVLEGVAFAIRDNLSALQTAGTQLARVTAVGGGSRSRYWLNLLATVLDMPVDVPAEGDFGAAFGAARLGLIAATGADPAAVCTPPAIAHTLEPETQQQDAYAAAYARYQALYPLLDAL